MTLPPSSRTLPAAVLWDMDGTLVDTEPYWVAEEGRLVREAGGQWSKTDGLELVGMDLREAATVLLRRTPLTGTPEGIASTLVGAVADRMREQLPWQPGARELLSALREAGVPMALVTMSWQVLADVMLEQLPPGTFAAVVTGDQVKRGKPHPEAYLTAALRLGLPPQDCLAIEDSPTGSAAAVAAGAMTIAVPNAVPVATQPGLVTTPTLQGLTPASLAALALSG